MNNKPVAYGKYIENAKMWLVVELDADMPKGYIPLYTHPHPDNLGLAESIIKQQKLEIDALHNLVKEQDKKIIDLAFEKVYAERSAEVLSELYTHPAEEQDESFDRTASHMAGEYVSYKAELTDEEIGDFKYQIIRACGLSTANSDINPIGLRQIIKAILRKAQENG